MDILSTIASTLLTQMQSPTLAFLLGGMVLAALGSKFEIPEPVYKFIVAVLLLKVGLGAGISVREANFFALIVPALGAGFIGVAIVLLGSQTLARFGGVSRADSMATVGLFGAVSASTLAAGMAILDDSGIYYEGFIGALYPFMDIAALVTAIVLAKMAGARAEVREAIAAGGPATPPAPGPKVFDTAMASTIITDTVRSGAISALLIGLAIGIFAEPETVYQSFYEPLFRGLLSLLMLVMGMEAYQRLAELKKVAHVYLAYGLIAPLVHGMMGFGVGMIAHELTGFSAGGVVLLAIMSAASSDVSGPPTMRAALPEANPSAYIGTSTGLGTPVAIFSIPLFVALAEIVI